MMSAARGQKNELLSWLTVSPEFLSLGGLFLFLLTAKWKNYREKRSSAGSGVSGI